VIACQNPASDQLFLSRRISLAAGALSNNCANDGIQIGHTNTKTFH